MCPRNGRGKSVRFGTRRITAAIRDRSRGAAGTGRLDRRLRIAGRRFSDHRQHSRDRHKGDTRKAEVTAKADHWFTKQSYPDLLTFSIIPAGPYQSTSEYRTEASSTCNESRSFGGNGSTGRKNHRDPGNPSKRSSHDGRCKTRAHCVGVAGCAESPPGAAVSRGGRR